MVCTIKTYVDQKLCRKVNISSLGAEICRAYSVLNFTEKMIYSIDLIFL